MAESILHLLMEELRSATSEKRIPGLERLLASYVLLMRALNDGKSSQTMETALSKTWRDLTVSEYSHVLGMVAEAAMGASDSSPDSLNFLTISMQLLHDSPEGL